MGRAQKSLDASKGHRTIDGFSVGRTLYFHQFDGEKSAFIKLYDGEQSEISLDEYRNASLADPNSLTVRVAAARCDTCIFSKNRPVGPERMRDLAQGWRASNGDLQGHQICHVFGVGMLTDDNELEDFEGEDVWCRGFYDNHLPAEIRAIGEARGWVQFITERKASS